MVAGGSISASQLMVTVGRGWGSGDHDQSNSTTSEGAPPITRFEACILSIVPPCQRQACQSGDLGILLSVFHSCPSKEVHHFVQCWGACSDFPKWPNLPSVYPAGLGADSLLGAMFEFSEVELLGLEPDEMALFMAVVLVSADRSGISDMWAVEQLQEGLIRALRSLITRRRPDDTALFPKLLLRLPDLRTLNNLHSDKLLAFRIDP
ncbi:nuclear receptor subfamily 1, group D, member 4a isoform X1 [Lates japonicus]|uniref:Nuclear receptor subfamily 1, group D, member 4a isoform X1 n=1 Tax=Lates japonicus TaxID=270547 RepID=A0AAD3NGX2_LATJO|nr:nuclear receptor subfamily 1, group D, member 4a isoform X1 [Lates japonicus]